MNSFFIIISGPTGVGKTDFVSRLSSTVPFPVEIINVDVGQFYAPLSIGTAKPDYKAEPIKHHFFDTITEPRDYTVAQFRERLLVLMQSLWSKGVTPVLVGGSGFYIYSLFFPPLEAPDQEKESELLPVLKDMSCDQIWQMLADIDPERAASIHPHDRYRVERALNLAGKGYKPSLQIPLFNPPGSCAFYFLTRDREQLYNRINKRVDEMLKQGWLEEVEKLNHAWKAFLRTKKLIGYPLLIDYLEKMAQGGGADLAATAECIKKQTRAYAKRQLTYWRMLRKKSKRATCKERI